MPTQMQQTATIIALTTLTVLAAVQILAACGLPVGRLLWGGAKRVLPVGMRWASVGAVVLYGVFAYILLVQGADLPLNGSGLIMVLSWVLFGYLVLATFGNLRSRSRAERYVMAPASAILAIATLIITLT
ncbi:hypothetical protein [Microbacterium sp.]|uniref:hypothetical protein n=1 Tax=Microbacterium sp. TaxID=51671 RepID=UPI002633C7BC|nr:hypothetical protein [Microbacterium sp.]